MAVHYQEDAENQQINLLQSSRFGEAKRLLQSYVRLQNGADRLNAGSVVSLASDTNQSLFEQFIKGGGFMSDALKEMLNPEFARLKVLLADSKAELADREAEITALKHQLAELQKTIRQ